jgi:hypothetical protein
MCRVDSTRVGSSDLREPFEFFLEHGELGGPNPSVVYFLIDAAKFNAGLIEMALQLFQLVINCYCLAFFKTVKKF